MFAQSSIVINPVKGIVSLFNGRAYIETHRYTSNEEIPVFISQMCENAGYDQESILKIVQSSTYDLPHDTYNLETKVIDERSANVIYGFILGVVTMLTLGVWLL